MLIKKLFVVSFAFVLFLSIGQISVFSQNTKLYEQPEYLMLTGRGEPKWELIGRLWEAEKFYPVGWSKDGKFAYYKEPPVEESSHYVGEIIIQDLKTDKILWKYVVDGYLEDLKDGEPKPNIDSLWKKNQKLFSHQLAKHKIVAIKDFKLKRSSISYENDILTPTLYVKFKSGDDGLYEIDGESFYGKRGKAVVSMFSEQKGKKVIFEKEYKSKGNTAIMDLELPGLLKSPFEPRAAVIVIEVLRGHEDSRITKINVVGSHLTKGFK